MTENRGRRLEKSWVKFVKSFNFYLLYLLCSR